MKPTTTIDEINGFIAYWTAQPDDQQKATVLKYWVKKAQKFITYHRTINGQRIDNTSYEVKTSIKTVANCFGVPQKKKGECRFTQMMRLTDL